MNKWLANALDYGITEADFWAMTIGEVERALQSKRKVESIKAKEKATYDYILADLIGRSIGRLYSSTAKIPPIEEAYPTIFDVKELEEQRTAKQDELSVLRFKLFADAHNKKFKDKGAK